jgi:hypothetical protein
MPNGRAARKPPAATRARPDDNNQLSDRRATNDVREEGGGDRAVTTSHASRIDDKDEADAALRREGHAAEDCTEFFQTVAGLADILAIKLYRLRLDEAPAVPILPCLDHEAMLHAGIAPHAAAYVMDETRDLHEVVYTPRDRRIDLDVVSTMNECTPAAHERFRASLAERFPQQEVHVAPVSWLRGDRRVAAACRAQVTLRDVLIGPDLDRTKRALDRLHIIGGLMEKESRVASWGARTIMTPFLALVGLLMLATLGAQSVAGWVVVARYVLTLAGAFFLYSGLKAVHLTEMANRVWKRTAEYSLILDERRRLLASPGPRR